MRGKGVVFHYFFVPLNAQITIMGSLYIIYNKVYD